MPELVKIDDLLTVVRQGLPRRDRVRIAFFPSLRKVFEVPEAVAMTARVRAALRADPRAELVDIDGLGYEHDIFLAGGDIRPAWQRFLAREVQGLLVMPSNYGDECGTSDLARIVCGALATPVYTVAPFDGPPRTDGTRPTDRTCGFFPMRQELRHAGEWPGYIPMSLPGDAVFKTGLENMLRAIAAQQAVQRLRILQIGGDQPTFPAIGTNKLDLYRAWGVRVEVGSMLTLVDQVRGRLAEPPRWLDDAVADLFTGVDVSEAVGFDPMVPKTAVLLLYGMLEMLHEKKCVAASPRCWSEVLAALRTMMCFDLGQLNEWDIPTACETDIYGVIAMVMLAAVSLGEQKPFFLDNTITLENGDICFWHCGPICRSCWREGCEAKLRTGWILQEPGAGYIHAPCLEIGDTVTLCRVSTDMNGDLITITHEAEVVEGPDTRGTYFYLRVKDWPAYERELMSSPVVHHWALIRGSYMHSIYQAANLLGMRCLVLNDGTDEIKRRIECRAARG